MNEIQLIADVIIRTGEILKMTLADFSDSDMLARPVKGANHAAWQLAHLTGATADMFNAVAPNVFAQHLLDLAQKYNGKTAHIDDPAFFPSKSELIEAFAQVTSEIGNYAQTLAPADLQKPTPGPMASFVPTVGHILVMTNSHYGMHLGQFQVIRRALGKPILF